MKSELTNLFEYTKWGDIYTLGSQMDKLGREHISDAQKEEIALSFLKELENSVQEILSSHDRHVYVARDINAIHLLLWFLLPHDSDVEYLPMQISNTGKDIKRLFKMAPGSVLAWEETESLFDYMKDTFDYFERVFPDQNPYILFFENQATSFVSEYIPYASVEDSPPIIIIPGVGQRSFDYQTHSAESVVFHALAKALIKRFLAAFHFSPSCLLKDYSDIEIARIHDFSPIQQIEIVTDAICMGFMCDSPYQKADPFIHVPNERKQQYRELAKVLIASC